jgi:hypothetical protein
VGRVTYHLVHTPSGALIRCYEQEGPALAFVRDVVRFGSRDGASAFALSIVDEGGNKHVVAAGGELVIRALEDRAP